MCKKKYAGINNDGENIDKKPKQTERMVLYDQEKQSEKKTYTQIW